MNNLSQSSLMAIHSILKLEVTRIQRRRDELEQEIRYCYRRAEKGTFDGAVYFDELNAQRTTDRWYKKRQKKIAKIIKELKGAMK
jgi:hypothetical protein